MTKEQSEFLQNLMGVAERLKAEADELERRATAVRADAETARTALAKLDDAFRSATA